MVSSASFATFNKDNFWIDAQILSNSRSNGRHSLLCLYNGSLALSLLGKDSNNANWSSISGLYSTFGNLGSSITRTASSLLGVSDNDQMHVLQYLEQFVINLKTLKPDEINHERVTLLQSAAKSLGSLADEYSFNEELNFENPKEEQEMSVINSNRSEAQHLKSNFQGAESVSGRYKILSLQIEAFVNEKMRVFQ
jgi:hypothetical protein